MTLGSDIASIGATVSLFMALYYFVRMVFSSTSDVTGAIDTIGEIGGSLANLAEGAAKKGWDWGKVGKDKLIAGIKWVGTKYDWVKEKEQANKIWGGIKTIGNGISSTLTKCKNQIKTWETTYLNGIKHIEEIKKFITQLKTDAALAEGDTKKLSETECNAIIGKIENEAKGILTDEKNQKIEEIETSIIEINTNLDNLIKQYKSFDSLQNFKQTLEINKNNNNPIREIGTIQEEISKSFNSLKKIKDTKTEEEIDELIGNLNELNYEKAGKTCEKLINREKMINLHITAIYKNLKLIEILIPSLQNFLDNLVKTFTDTIDQILRMPEETPKERATITNISNVRKNKEGIANFLNVIQSAKNSINKFKKENEAELIKILVYIKDQLEKEERFKNIINDKTSIKKEIETQLNLYLKTKNKNCLKIISNTFLTNLEGQLKAELKEAA